MRADISRTSRSYRSAVAMLLIAVMVVAGIGSPPALAAGSCPEPNDTADRACELRLDQAIEDELSSAEDADRFRLAVKDGQSIQVTAKSSVGFEKLRIEAPDGKSIAEVGLGDGERQVAAERLPEGTYTVYLSGEGADPGQSYPYTINATEIGSGAAVPLESGRGHLRNLTLSPADIGAQALQTAGRLRVSDHGRIYEVVYERENTLTARRNGPMYILNRVFVAESGEKAQAVYDAWNVFDMPEAGPDRPFESLGDQTMPGFGDAAHAIGACVKCDDDNPLRSYRMVARFDTVVYMLYSWGRDASANFDVVMDLAYKMEKHLDSAADLRGPELARSFLTR